MGQPLIVLHSHVSAGEGPYVLDTGFSPHPAFPGFVVSSILSAPPFVFFVSFPGIFRFLVFSVFVP